jgi:hypothetical protein
MYTHIIYNRLVSSVLYSIRYIFDIQSRTRRMLGSPSVLPTAGETQNSKCPAAARHHVPAHRACTYSAPEIYSVYALYMLCIYALRTLDQEHCTSRILSIGCLLAVQTLAALWRRLSSRVSWLMLATKQLPRLDLPSVAALCHGLPGDTNQHRRSSLPARHR